MKDYSEMSDFEINKEVAYFKIGGNWELEPNDERKFTFYNHGVKTKNTVELPDYCNSWADAGPIIEQNKIKIQVVKRVRNYNERYEAWEASFNSPHFEEECANPLRAAMIVFLMMKEGEND